MKKLFLSALLLLLLSLPAHGQIYIRGGQLSQDFTCALAGIAATLTQCQAVPAVATTSYYITDIKVQSTTATSGLFNIESGTGTNCASSTTAVFPSSSVSDKFNQAPNTAAMTNLSFVTPIKVLAGHAICLLGVATNTTSIQISGFIQ